MPFPDGPLSRLRRRFFSTAFPKYVFYLEPYEPVSMSSIRDAVGPRGYQRLALQADRDRQIADVVAWLNGTDGTVH
jgi:hypothetical protein